MLVLVSTIILARIELPIDGFITDLQSAFQGKSMCGYSD